ncbi:polysaccharide deacetylase family protein [Chryseomicrobium palamuruense]|uniref:Polysaccharide deacetylase family protein n=1 Tax=Chryseomicrobium palamuruense TaxID=682973 RepID=A0ABV8UWG8_9BACL
MRTLHLLGITLLLSVSLLSWQWVSAASDSYSFGLKRATNEEPPEIGAKLESVLAKHDALLRDTSGAKTIYLTFDNGYENGQTTAILDTLKKENIQATFFLTGHYLKSAPDFVKRMIADGHTIGNHTYSHPNMATLSEKELTTELRRFDEELNKLTGISRTTIVRPPEGIFSERSLRVANQLGYQHIFWTMAIVDWHEDRVRGKEVVTKELVNQLHPGAIVLLHTVSADNSQALPDFIAQARAKGYEFADLEELRKQSVNTPFPFQ